MDFITEEELISRITHLVLNEKVGGLRLWKGRPNSAYSILERPQDAFMEWCDHQGSVGALPDSGGLPEGSVGLEYGYRIEYSEWDDRSHPHEGGWVTKVEEYVVKQTIPEELQKELQIFQEDE